MQKVKYSQWIITVILICGSILFPYLQCQSQTITEPTTSVPNSKLRDAVKLIELGKIDRELVKAYKIQVEFLNQRIAILDSMVKAYVVKDTAGTRIVETYKAEVQNLKDQVVILVPALKKQNKLYRRQKRKTVFVAVAGPVVTAAAFIYFKK